MLAPPRLAPRGPSTTRRRAVGGSVLGLGLLVAAGATAPAALAAPDPTDDSPAPDAQPATPPVQAEVLGTAGVEDERAAATIEGFFGRGKSVPLQVGYDPATAPAGLSLAGAEFTVSDGDDVVGTCTTGTAGVCTVHTVMPDWTQLFASTLRVFSADDEVAATDLYLPGGEYTVTQTTAPAGLSPATGTGTLDVCDPFSPCSGEDFPTVVDDSLFSSPVRGTVVDVVTGAPIGGAAYTLTGPADAMSPREDDTAEEGPADDESGPADDESGDLDEDETSGEPVLLDASQGAATAVPARESLTVTSSPTGQLVFEGWFLPSEDYLLTPGDAVSGYDADQASIPVRLGAPTGDGSGALAPRLLHPVTPPTATPPTSTPTPGTSTPDATGSSAPSGAGAPVAVAASRAPSSTTAAPTVPAATSAPATPTRSTTEAAPSAVGVLPVSPVADQPELQTEGSSMVDPAIIGFGLFFLVLVATGLGWIVRRRVRAAD